MKVLAVFVLALTVGSISADPVYLGALGQVVEQVTAGLTTGAANLDGVVEQVTAAVAAIPIVGPVLGPIIQPILTILGTILLVVTAGTVAVLLQTINELVCSILDVLTAIDIFGLFDSLDETLDDLLYNLAIALGVLFGGIVTVLTLAAAAFLGVPILSVLVTILSTFVTAVDNAASTLLADGTSVVDNVAELLEGAISAVRVELSEFFECN